MEVRFQPATSADIDPVVVLIREFYVHDQHVFDETLTLPALRTLLENPQYGGVWLVVVGETLAGYFLMTYGFALESGGRDLLIDEFYLREAYRRQGIGHQIIAFAREFCARQGIRKIYLEVEGHNAAARAFYEREGFVFDGSIFMGLTL